jgi:hypothetical protein
MMIYREGDDDNPLQEEWLNSISEEEDLGINA